MQISQYVILNTRYAKLVLQIRNALKIALIHLIVPLMVNVLVVARIMIVIQKLFRFASRKMDYVENVH